jgi:SAM-dependent methyltransferase
VRADATRVPFADACFDGVVVLFSSFGYFGEQGDARMLDEVARLLRPGGLAVLDLMNPSRIRAGLVPDSRRSGPGFELVERRHLEQGGRRVVKQVELTLTDASAGGPAVRRWREDVRMYEPAEVRALLGRCGLVLERAAGDFGLVPQAVDGAWSGPVPAAPRMLLFARAPTRALSGARA